MRTEVEQRNAVVPHRTSEHHIDPARFGRLRWYCGRAIRSHSRHWRLISPPSLGGEGPRRTVFPRVGPERTSETPPAQCLEEKEKRRPTARRFDSLRLPFTGLPSAMTAAAS